jgi:DNA-binding PadR family transcriptional regulator
MGHYIKEALDHFWSESYGQLYPELRRLEAEGLAKKKVVPQKGHADRNEYQLTRAGKQALTRWLAEPVEEAPRRNELMLKLAFGNDAGPSDMVRHVQAARADALRRLAIYQTVGQELEAGHWNDDPNTPYWALTLDHGLCVAEAEAKWCEAALKKLRQLDQARAEAAGAKKSRRES